MTSVPAAKAGVEAPWKQRFRVERILWSALAEERPDRGLVAANHSGRYQLYAWQVPAGELRQLTDRPEGVLFGFVDSLGRHGYYLDDRDGNEIGHLVPAKIFRVKVTEWMVGFGPTAWSRRRGETEYGIKWIPFGGYIRMVGMLPPAPDTAAVNAA